MTTLTPQQVALYLTDTYWKQNGEEPRAWNVKAGGTVTVNLAGLPAAEARIANLALMAWEGVTGLRFARTAATGQITLDDRQDGAWSQVWMDVADRITRSTVNVSSAWARDYGATLDSYYMQTMVHELGHSLGLGHTGDYNGWALYDISNWFDNDSWQMSVMSYFAPSPDENWRVPASYAYAITPMPADILAMHRLYGTPTGVGAGHTTYGHNTNAPGIYGEIGRALQSGALTDPVMWTIFDQGGIDTLDFTGDRANQVIRLGALQFSDVLGQRGNVGIAHGTVIERAFAGHGHDRVTGNAAANDLRGNAGNDSLSGLAGNDTLTGGTGRDRLWGQDGADRLLGGDGEDLAWGDAGNDWLDGAAGADSLWGGAGDDRIYGGDDADSLTGDAGVDSLYGGSGNDRLDGGADNDMLNGGLGHDLVRGGAGNDRIVGGGGRDTLYGGAGADLFIFAPADADAAIMDRIVDFQRGVDRIDLRALDLDEEGVSALSGRAAPIRQTRDGANLRIQGDLDGDGRADLTILVGGTAALTADSFLI